MVTETLILLYVQPSFLEMAGILVCFSCGRADTKDDEFQEYKGQEQFKDVFNQCSAPSSQPGSAMGSRNGSYKPFGGMDDTDSKPEPGAETFSMAEMSYATSNWSTSNKIGQGGFGMVYKGRLRDGRMVAIKRGRKDAFAHRLLTEFRTEVEMLSQVCSQKYCVRNSIFQCMHALSTNVFPFSQH